MYEQDPRLARNESRDFVIAEINATTEAFRAIREGQIDVFQDATGLHDDGGGNPYLVNIDNVESYEPIYRHRWSWLCPQLIDNAADRAVKN